MKVNVRELCSGRLEGLSGSPHLLMRVLWVSLDLISIVSGCGSQLFPTVEFIGPFKGVKMDPGPQFQRLWLLLSFCRCCTSELSTVAGGGRGRGYDGAKSPQK